MNLQSIVESNLSSDLISSPFVLDETGGEIGTVSDVLIEESGHFRYLVVQTGDELSNRQFLVPVGMCRSYNESNAIALVGVSQEQDLEQLPIYENSSEINYDYEENIRQVYRQLLTLDNSAATTYERDSYSYDNEPELYGVSTDRSQTIRLYEEKLVANKERLEVGEVTIGKKIETETKEVEIPIEKEKVVVKVQDVAEEIPAEPGEAKFEEGAVAKVKVYEEKAEVGKKAFVRQEVEVKKEVEGKIVNAEETLRKEELEMTGGENIEIEK